MPRKRFLAVLALLLSCFVTGCSGKRSAPPAAAPTLSFAAPFLVPHGGVSGRELTLADVDRDGFPDALLVDEQSGRLLVLRGSLNGFLGPLQKNLGAAAGVLAVGDWNGDRNLDVVTVSRGPGSLALSFGDGRGDFFAAAFSVPFDGANDVAVADFDGDGAADVAIARADRPQVTVFFGDGRSAVRTVIEAALPGLATELVIGDWNRDGRLDLAALAEGDVLILLQAVGGAFGAPRSASLTAAGRGLVAGDADADGLPDLMVLDATGLAALILIGDGRGSFTAVPPVAIPAVAGALALADLDADGRQDLCLALGVQILASYGAVGWHAFESLMVGGSDPAELRVADLDLDGHLDLAFLTGAGQLGVLRNPKTAPAGVATFGLGTPGCRGASVLSADGPAVLGNATFHILCVNAPRQALGYLLLGGPGDPVGSDRFGLGFRVHLASGLIIEKLWFSDIAGTARRREPLPDEPSLAGFEVFGQALWLEPAPTCSTSPFAIVSSRGLQLTLRR